MSLDSSLNRIVSENQSARSEASSRLARLVGITASGTTDELREFASELLTSLEAESGGTDGEVTENTTVVGDAGSGELAG